MRFHTWVEMIGTAAAVLVLGTAFALNPDPRGFGTHEGLGLPPCAHLMRTGRPCLSCGMTTAFANLARGRVVSAWRANPAAIPLFLVTLGLPPWLFYSWRRRRDPFRFLDGKFTRWIPLALLIALLGSWLARGGLSL